MSAPFVAPSAGETPAVPVKSLIEGLLFHRIELICQAYQLQGIGVRTDSLLMRSSEN